MFKRISRESSAQLLQTIMINHFDGWLRLPITNLVDRQDIIRFCCSRSWQAAHILRALFALNQIDHLDYTNVEKDVADLPRRPDSAYNKLYALTCSSDFRSAALAGLDLMREIVLIADTYYPEIRGEAFLQATANRVEASATIEQKMHLAQAAADAYTCVPGIRGVIIEGSLAKGTADMTSDIDLKAYCKTVPDVDFRKSRVRILDENSQLIPESDRLTIGGVYVHIDFESINVVEDTFAAFPRPPWWAPAKWEPIQIGEIAWDPDLILQKWKQIISDMPPEPRKNLVLELLRHLSDEKQRFHAALDTGDPVYCSILLGNMLSYYFQILGIINHLFIIFPKWMHYVIQDIDSKPSNMYERFCVMLSRDLYRDTLIELSEEFEMLSSDLVVLIEEFYPEIAGAL